MTYCCRCYWWHTVAGAIDDILLQVLLMTCCYRCYWWHTVAGAIDDKYDIAISTACGPLDNIVVDTLKTGQQCVEYLKRANLGVCTFILLEKMEQWVEKADRPIKTYDTYSAWCTAVCMV